MPVPKRFDRRPPERDDTRINERIRVPEVRLIGDDGEQIGIVKRDDALRYAQERDLDLVVVAAEAKPPVCRVLDYSKYKYEQEQRQKAARKHQTQITIREIKFRPKIAQNDYDTKKGHVTRFLKQRDKVKVTIMFRGREVTHPERGVALLDRLADELQDLAVVEQRPIQDGRNMTMMLGPSKAILDAPEEEHEETVVAGKTSRRERLKAEKQAAAEGRADAPATPAEAEEPPADAEVTAEPQADAQPQAAAEPQPEPQPERAAEAPAEPQPEPAERA